MSNVRVHISASLDGYVAGPNQSLEYPLGEGGERLHDWLVELKSWREHAGMEAADGGGGGGGPQPPFHKPVFVLTHHEREPLTLSDTTFTFVTDGIQSALERAKAVAGDKDILLGGGADVINQYLAAGLVDELELHVVPLLLGGGARLFAGVGPDLTLEQVRAVEAPGVAHLKYRVPSTGSRAA